MANFEIDEEVLVAFLKGELDAAQAAAVEAWYDRSAANRRMLGQVYYILYVSDRINDAAGIDVEPDFAMAGLKDETKIDEALAAVSAIVKKALG